jgi:hypothetical protein
MKDIDIAHANQLVIRIDWIQPGQYVCSVPLSENPVSIYMDLPHQTTSISNRQLLTFLQSNKVPPRGSSFYLLETDDDGSAWVELAGDRTFNIDARNDVTVRAIPGRGSDLAWHQSIRWIDDDDPLRALKMTWKPAIDAVRDYFAGAGRNKNK